MMEVMTPPLGRLMLPVIEIEEMLRVQEERAPALIVTTVRTEAEAHQEGATAQTSQRRAENGA